MADEDVLTENTPTLILDVCVCIGPQPTESVYTFTFIQWIVRIICLFP